MPKWMDDLSEDFHFLYDKYDSICEKITNFVLTHKDFVPERLDALFDKINPAYTPHKNLAELSMSLSPDEKSEPIRPEHQPFVDEYLSVVKENPLETTLNAITLYHIAHPINSFRYFRESNM